MLTAGQHELAVLMVDNPPGQNSGLYRFLPLDPDPGTQGSWEVLPYHSGVLAIHAAVLRVGQGDVLRRSGNNQVRVASPDYGNVAKGIYTSVTWDPAAPAAGGANFFHPDTITGPDHKPFDYFCGGDTFLPDGTLLSAGGNLVYPGKGRPTPSASTRLLSNGTTWAACSKDGGTPRCCRWPTGGCSRSAG